MSLISLSTIATMYCPSTITSTCMHKNCKIVLVQQLAVSFLLQWPGRGGVILCLFLQSSKDDKSSLLIDFLLIFMHRCIVPLKDVVQDHIPTASMAGLRWSGGGTTSFRNDTSVELGCRGSRDPPSVVLPRLTSALQYIIMTVMPWLMYLTSDIGRSCIFFITSLRYLLTICIIIL